MAICGIKMSTPPKPAITPSVSRLPSVRSKSSPGVRIVTVTDRLSAYVVDLGRASREHPQVQLGASPRALLQWVRAAKSHAAISGRDHVLPEDVRAVAEMVLSHRLILTRRALADGVEPAAVVQELLASTPVS